MARLFSLPVLGGGIVLASPALYAAFVTATMPVETAVVRLLVAVAVLWLGLGLIGSLVEGTSAPRRPADPAGQSARPPVQAAVVDDSGGR